MRQSRSRQSGFTLIEIAVVVIILATISAISLFAINQAFDRRFVSQADNLLVWFNQLSDQAALEAVPYGVMDNRQEAEEPVRFFKVVAYYRQYWLPVKYPESFTMEEGTRIEWVISAAENYDQDYDSVYDDENMPVPVIAMMPDGYMEPRAEMILSFDASSVKFRYYWDDKSGSMAMSRVRQ